jgi:hypothetical protein
MYKDIISYQLSEHTTQEQLLTVAKRIVDEWMKTQPGFIKWEINVNSDGSYTDIVYWKSEADAKASEKDMINIPNASEWFACYKEGSLASKNVTTVAFFE